ncbi:hypothetical protein EYF80_044984 [Liparis tanakae]|uniref:Uncharacterized protein n=1 Tax=Liparis tanakae TaxID=230148 RepID=A0A4Z2FUH2_9TELE|nr:hypothetical protein EYF80_044984 [Liparis tanakae]
MIPVDLFHQEALPARTLREDQVFLVSLVVQGDHSSQLCQPQGCPHFQVYLVVREVLLNLANQADRVLYLPWSLEVQESQVALLCQAPLKGPAGQETLDLLVLKSPGVQGDQGALEAQKVQFVLLHHEDQGHLLVLVIRVLQVCLAILACQVFLFRGSLEDQEALAFLVALIIPGLVAQGGLVVPAVLLVLGDPEHLVWHLVPQKLLLRIPIVVLRQGLVLLRRLLLSIIRPAEGQGEQPQLEHHVSSFVCARLFFPSVQIWEDDYKKKSRLSLLFSRTTSFLESVSEQADGRRERETPDSLKREVARG